MALIAAAPARAEDDEDDSPIVEAGEEEVVEVIGQRDDGAPEPQSTSAAVTVIEVDERLPASADVAAVVGSAAGVHAQRLGGLGEYSAVTIRGSSARQVEVCVDGVPLNPHGGHAVNLAELSLDAYERIEVYRSGAPAELGSAAVGGVVNLVSAPGELPPPHLEIGGGTFATHRLAASGGVAGPVGARRLPGDLWMTFEAFGTENDFEYFDDHGTEFNTFDDRTLTRINADIHDLAATVRGRLGRDRWRVTVQDALILREQGLPGIGHDQATQARLGVADNTALVQVRGRPHDLVRLRGRVSYRLRHERFGDLLGELGYLGRSDSRDLHHAASVVAHGAWVPIEAMALSLTAEARFDAYRPEDLLRDPPTDGVRQRVAGIVSLADDISLAGDRVRVSPVAQVHLLDNRMLGDVPFGSSPVAPDGEAFHAAFTPRIGVVARPMPVLAFKANVGRFFRPPDFHELFGDRGAVIGNADLVPESGVAWDGGVRLVVPEHPVVAGSLEVTGFGRDTRDAIVYFQNAQRTQIPVNLGRALVGGVEGAADLRLGGVFDLRGAVTYLESENLDTREAYAGNQLPRMPLWEVELAAALAWRDRVRLGYDLSHTAGNYWDATNWYLAAPRTLHGLFLRVRPGPRWPFLEVEVRNLLDRRVEAVPRDPLNPDDGALVVRPLTDFAGYPLPGRTILVTLGADLGTAEGAP